MKINMPFSSDKYRYSSGYPFFFFVVWPLWWSFYAIWLKNKLGLSGMGLGMLYVTNQFFSIPFMLVYGSLQDKLGTRKHLIWLIGTVITLSGPFLIYVYELLLTSNFKLGVALGAIFFGLGCLTGCGLVESLVEKASRKFNFEFGTARLWGSLGYAVGTFVGGIFFSINPHISLWCVSVMGVSFPLIDVLLKANSPALSSAKTCSPELDALIRKDFPTISKDTQFWSFVIFVVGTWSSYSIYYQQMSPVLYASLFDDSELAPRIHGYLNSVQVFMEAAGMASVPFLIDRIGPKSALLLGDTIMVCRILGPALFTDIYIISLIRMFHVLGVPLFVTSAFKPSAANLDKHLPSAIHLIGFNITSPIDIIVPSLSVGKLFDKVGYQEIFLTMASIVIITLISDYFLLNKKHRQQKTGNELVTEQRS